MRAAASYDCGCHIEQWAAAPVIRMCLTHEAAFRVADALETMIDQYDPDEGYAADVIHSGRRLLTEIGRPHPSLTMNT